MRFPQLLLAAVILLILLLGELHYLLKSLRILPARARRLFCSSGQEFSTFASRKS